MARSDSRFDPRDMEDDDDARLRALAEQAERTKKKPAPGRKSPVDKFRAKNADQFAHPDGDSAYVK